MFKKILLLSFGLLFITISQAKCPATLSDTTAIKIAQDAMDTWFTAIQKNDVPTVQKLFAPQFIVLHSKGAPMTKDEELKLLTGFHLGRYQFSDFCAMRMNNIIIATFASKTFGQDISATKVNFLSPEKAYRMVVLKKLQGKWLIVAYANTNPIN